MDRSAREVLWHLANLAVLWTFAVAQPLFDLLGDNPEFFAARGSTGFDIVSFTVLLVVVPPLLLLAIQLLLRPLGQAVFERAHLVMIGALVTLIAAHALKESIDPSDVILIALSVAIGAALAALYARAEPVRSFLNVLTPAPLVFLLLFLLASPVSRLAFPEEAGARTVGSPTRAPVVVVLLDELPTNTLVDEDNRLDTTRYPGFAELAREATWFRNAYTVYDSTERAQPAIMDGNLPDKDKLPISADHPASIFSLFARSHRLNASEEATTVCSRDLCEDERLEEPYGDRISSMSEDLGLVWLHMVSPSGIEEDLPSVSQNWGDFGGDDDEGWLRGTDGPVDTTANLNAGRSVRFQAWIENIRRGGRPALSFKHTLLPHEPWVFLPSGRRYRLSPSDVVPGLSNKSYDDQGQQDVLLQRHYLQTGFTDLMLRRLWDHLKSEGLWDESLIVVAADHGMSFIQGRSSRRRLDRENFAEIAPIPLFIKPPGQRTGSVDDSYVETVDILPTILDILNVDPRVEMDGHSAFSKTVRQRDAVRVLDRATFEPLRLSAEEFEAEKALVRERNARLFGTGKEGVDRLFRIGPHQELLGRRAPAGSGSGSVEIFAASDWADVEPSSGFVPAHAIGRIDGDGEGGRNIALALNGRIAAVGSTFVLASGEPGELFSVMVPESALRRGRNPLDVFEVSADGSLTRLGGV